MSRLLNKGPAKRALAKVERIAQQIRPLFSEEDAFTKHYTELHDILDDELGDDEYFVIVDEQGVSYIHTNRLLEGTVFSDDVGLKAARTDSPLLQDRKSTRLNSSHVAISYAVFCLKKKTRTM